MLRADRRDGEAACRLRRAGIAVARPLSPQRDAHQREAGEYEGRRFCCGFVSDIGELCEPGWATVMVSWSAPPGAMMWITASRSAGKRRLPPASQ